MDADQTPPDTDDRHPLLQRFFERKDELEADLFGAPSTDRLFNPYRDAHPEHDVPEAAALRRANLRAALDAVPHAAFTFAKLWLAAADLEVRAKDLGAARRLLGEAQDRSDRNQKGVLEAMRPALTRCGFRGDPPWVSGQAYISPPATFPDYYEVWGRDNAGQGAKGQRKITSVPALVGYLERALALAGGAGALPSRERPRTGVTESPWTADEDAALRLLLGHLQQRLALASARAAEDAGATASDNLDGDLTSSIVTTGLPVDSSAAGAQLVTHTVTNSRNQSASISRSIVIAPPRTTTWSKSTTRR
mgnify:CR=1 FL=1